MTPKEQYEARKAERHARRQSANGTGRTVHQDEQDFLMFLDLADRFVTAAERIADALELSNQVTMVTVGDVSVRSVGDT